MLKELEQNLHAYYTRNLWKSDQGRSLLPYSPVLYAWIIFGLSLAAGYILTYNYTKSEIIAGTASFAITLLSPQIYVFILREGTVFEKFKRKNLLLKTIFIITLLMILGIIYIPALNTLFTTTPIYDLYIWGIIIIFSCLTTIIRALLKENLIIKLKSEKNGSNMLPA